MCVCLFDFYYTAQIDPQEASSGKCGGQIKNPNQMVSNHVNSSVGFLLNTYYLTDSYIGFTLTMESVTKNTIFGLEMVVKSGLEKFVLKSLHGGR